MSEASPEPKAVVRALVEAYNAKAVEAVAALYHPDAYFWDPLHRDGVRGREGVAAVVRDLFAAYPDERMAIVTLAGDERRAVAEFRSTATVPASGERMELEFTEVYEVREGLVTSCRVYLDPEGLPP